ncbi:MAG TPA: DUF2336 domain-containing protein [Parvibaculum sp.]
MQERLSVADVQRLLSEPTEEARAGIATKVAAQFRNVVLMPNERELAREILGYLVHDTATHVRTTLSKCLSDVTDAPRDIVLALARDIDEVALPILESSTVLNEEEMAELVLSGSANKQCAIARRPDIGAAVCNAVARAGDRSAVIALAANDGIVIRPEILEKIVDRYPADEIVLDPIARRADLPGVLVERIVTIVSKQLRDQLIERHGVDKATAALLEDLARERSLVSLLGSIDADGMLRLVAQLSEQRHLTASLLLRALCAAEMKFVETAFAFLTTVPHEKVERLIHDVGALGFRAVYARAGLPEALYPAFRAALDTLHEMGQRALLPDKRIVRRIMLQRVGAPYRDLEAKDIDLLLDRLTRSTRALPWRAGHAA